MRYLEVEQVGSPIRRQCQQRKTLIGLGLNKIGRSRWLEDTPAVRSHHNMLAIFVLNLLSGWTVVGWIAALVWAVTASVPVVLVQRDSSIAG